VPPLIVAGHSHIAAFAPTPANPQSPTWIEGEGVRVLHGPLPRDAGYWDTFVHADTDAPHVIVWGGDQHLRRLLIEPVPPIDFVLSAAPELTLDPRASYLAESQLRAVFAPSFGGLAELIRALRASGAPVLVAGTPPPIGEVEALAQRLPRDPQFAPLLQASEAGPAAPISLSSPYTLQKIWSLLQLILAETAAAEGARFVPTPDRTRTLEGFLAPAYWSDDPIHANAAFGRELASDLSAALGQGEA
jgi:hypothetical protein